MTFIRFITRRRRHGCRKCSKTFRWRVFFNHCCWVCTTSPDDKRISGVHKHKYLVVSFLLPVGETFLSFRLFGSKQRKEIHAPLTESGKTRAVSYNLLKSDISFVRNVARNVPPAEKKEDRQFATLIRQIHITFTKRYKQLTHFEWGAAEKRINLSKSCRPRQMLRNETSVTKIGFDKAENEPFKVWITDHTFDHILSLL